MNYWHIQMNQPWGRNKGKIDSSMMLKDNNPIIGTGEWDNHQYNYFINKDDNVGLKADDIVLVREGKKPIALVQVIDQQGFHDKDLSEKYFHSVFRKIKVLGFTDNLEKFPQPQGTIQRLIDPHTASYQYVNSFYKKILQMKNNENFKNILFYKKQIILQGPPGTGKTREAKLIVDDIFDSEIKDEINAVFLDHLLIPGYKYQLGITTTAKIVSKTGDRITLDIASPNQPPVNFTIKDVLDVFESKTYLDKKLIDYTPNAIRSLLLSIIRQLRKSKIEEQFKLIQFHPSYTYEDFVRGIVAKPNPEGEGIIYDAENKTLADFAEKALKNYKAYNNSDTISIPTLKDFINIIIEEIDEKEKYQLTDKVYIYYVDEKRLKYKGDNWTAHPNGLNMNFSEIQKILDARHTTRQEISKNENLNALTRQHATYYQKFIELFQEFKVKNQTKEIQNVPLRKYMLVIDEINRANLSSVLGELIYALEYRGEAVDSMYEVNGRDLILPPNLYIIGTMNTADRSVGHIDYAIRRRFAFVDILPKDLSQEPGIKFDSTLFTQVSNLFNDHTSPEFQQKDIQLGHSYFIDKSSTGGNMQVRLDYEIKPILQEYAKDGILIGDEIVEKINRLTPSI
ncbi:AAA family ATPase [Elizabethkingia meningoseptica]|uniref:ATPase n=2 Tax=Elizabethkingia meningoseptica TaxID=238 RepID=A0A1T3EZP1_ELIME|nr:MULTISPECIES: AAA family ATPase [Elizabethkingia]AQX06683.1 ATPase [Elizabethkingia meningoseptica]AQX10942.1 ATPase [Elizabethkingia meningoseptica]AQX48731.1 ATPase [Elizabethkingia meningoseptica]EJK5330082.1 AAA family ATPase [Elizabethkingia meningoseptica]EOR28431.1 ATPase [Elizabethkingia meningoseptica ATCC 13253 = NBRC 12535]